MRVSHRALQKRRIRKNYNRPRRKDRFFVPQRSNSKKGGDCHVPGYISIGYFPASSVPATVPHMSNAYQAGENRIKTKPDSIRSGAPVAAANIP